MNEIEPKAGWARELGFALLLLIFQLLVHLPELATQRTPLPADARIAPPWWRPGVRFEQPQDLGGTDKLVFTLPNLIHWERSVREDPGGLLWNPWNFAGHPFLATQDSFALYPFNALCLVVSPVRALQLSAILHSWLASLFSFWLLRRLGRRSSAALIGGAFLGASPWVLAHLDVINFLQAATWIPALLLGALHCLQGRRRRGILGLALATALSFLGGMAQITLIGLLLAGVGTVLCLPFVIRRAGVRFAAFGGLSALAGVVLGVLLAAPQILPSMEMAQDSSRAELDKARLAESALAPAELITQVAPMAFGCPAELDRLAREHQLPPGHQLEETSFLPAAAFGLGGEGKGFMERVTTPGALGLLLILASIGGLALGQQLAAWALLLFGLSASMNTPVFSALYDALPMFRSGSPRRFAVIAVLAQAWLITLGAERVLQGARNRRFAWPALLWTAAVISCLVVPDRLATWLPDASSLDPVLRAEQEAFLPDWCLRVFLPAMLLGLLLLPLGFGWLRARPRLRFALLFLLLAGELALFQWRCNPGQDPQGVPVADAKILDGLQKRLGDGQSRFVRYHGAGSQAPYPPLPPNLGLLRQLRDVQGYEGLVDRRREELYACLRPDLAHAHHLLREIPDPALLSSPLLDLLAVRWVLATARLPLVAAEVDLEALCAVFVRPNARSRWRVPKQIAILPDDVALLERLRRKDHDPDTLLVVESDARTLGLRSDRSQDPQACRLSLESERACELVFEVEAKKEVIVGLADGWHRDWIAEDQSGRPLVVTRADHALRAIRIPAGCTQLRLRFVPRSFITGLWLCAAAVLISAVGFWRLGRERPAGTPPEA